MSSTATAAATTTTISPQPSHRKKTRNKDDSKRKSATHATDDACSDSRITAASKSHSSRGLIVVQQDRPTDKLAAAATTATTTPKKHLKHHKKEGSSGHVHRSSATPVPVSTTPKHHSSSTNSIATAPAGSISHGHGHGTHHHGHGHHHRSHHAHHHSQGEHSGKSTAIAAATTTTTTSTTSSSHSRHHSRRRHHHHHSSRSTSSHGTSGSQRLPTPSTAMAMAGTTGCAAMPTAAVTPAMGTVTSPSMSSSSAASSSYVEDTYAESPSSTSLTPPPAVTVIHPSPAVATIDHGHGHHRTTSNNTNKNNNHHNSNHNNNHQQHQTQQQQQSQQQQHAQQERRAVSPEAVDPAALEPFFLSLIHEAESIGRIGRMETLSAAVTYASDKYAEGAGKLYGLLAVTSAMAREYIAGLGMVDAVRAVSNQPPWSTRYGSEDDKEARRHYANVLSYVVDLHIAGNRAVCARESVLDFSCAEHREPTISVRQYVERIMRYAPATKELYVVVLILLDRLLAMNPGLILTGRNAHRLIVTAVVVASKMFDDFFYTNKYLAVVAGVATEELNHLELRLLTRLRFSLFVPTPLFAEYRRLFEQVVSFARSNEDLHAFFDTVYPPYRAQVISRSDYRRSSTGPAGVTAAALASTAPRPARERRAAAAAGGSVLRHERTGLFAGRMTPERAVAAAAVPGGRTTPGKKVGALALASPQQSLSPMSSASPHSVALTLRSARSSVSSISALSLLSARDEHHGAHGYVDDDEENDDEEEEDIEYQNILAGKGGNSWGKDKCERSREGAERRVSKMAELEDAEEGEDDVVVIVEGVNENGDFVDTPY